jgi:alpha-galactosidase
LKIINLRRRRSVAGRVMAALMTLVGSGLATFSPSSAAPETAGLAIATSNGPVMGYDNWYLDHCRTSERRVLSEARALISTGLAAAGYKTVIADDCWMAARRTPRGLLTWNRATFPDGIPALAAKIHAMGLKFGLYEDAGLRTCALRPGDLGHYSTDAATFKSWHVDLVKIDMCQFPKHSTFSQIVADYTQLGNDLAAAGIAYSDELPVKALIDFGDASPEYMQAVKISSAHAAMWRVAVDERSSVRLALIERQRELLRLDNGHQVPLTYLVGTYANVVIRGFAVDLPLAAYARPGHWNDLDVLLPGNPNYRWTNSQAVSQMSIWAELASPLIVCTDVATLSPALLADLKNPAMIGIDQSGSQGHQITSQGPVIAVGKPDPLGGTALLLVNMSPRASRFDVPLTQLGFHAASLSVTNIWSGRSWTVTGRFQYELAAESATLFHVRFQVR